MGRKKKIEVYAGEKRLPAKTKDIITSWILVTARYDFTVGENRILLKIYERLQEMLKDHELKTEEFDNIFEKYGSLKLHFTPKELENNDHYCRLRSALDALHSKKIEYSTDKIKWGAFHLIEGPAIYKDGKYSLAINEQLVRLFCNFNRGWRRYNLQTALSFRNVGSARLYAMFSEQENTVRDYYIDDLRKMLGYENKYPLINDFDRFVLQPAQKELKQKSDWFFEYSFRKDPMNPRKFKVIHIRIKPNPKFISAAEMVEVDKYLDAQKPSKYQQFIDMLRNQIGYSDQDVQYTEEEILNFFKLCAAFDQDPISWLEEKFKYIVNMKGTMFEVKRPIPFMKSCILNYPSNSTESLKVGPMETIRMFALKLEKEFPKKYKFVRDNKKQIIGYELFTTSITKNQFEQLKEKLLQCFDYDRNRLEEALPSIKKSLEFLYNKVES